MFQNLTLYRPVLNLTLEFLCTLHFTLLLSPNETSHRPRWRSPDRFVRHTASAEQRQCTKVDEQEEIEESGRDLPPVIPQLLLRAIAFPHITIPVLRNLFRGMR